MQMDMPQPQVTAAGRVAIRHLPVVLPRPVAGVLAAPQRLLPEIIFSIPCDLNKHSSLVPETGVFIKIMSTAVMVLL